MRKVAFILSFFCAVTVYAQQEDEVRNNLLKGTSDEDGYLSIERRNIVPEKSIVFNLGYNIPFVSNSLINSDFWDKKMGTGIELGVDFRKQFQSKKIEDEYVISVPQSFAIGAGLGISYFHQSAKFENFSEVLSNYTDVDGDVCNINLSYQNVEESVSLAYLDVPLYFEIGKPSQTKTSAYFKLGLKASLLIFEKFSGTGTYTSTGSYSGWNATLHDIPVLDYYTDKPCYDNPEYELSPFVLWGTVAGGVNFSLSSIEKNELSAWILRISAKADYSLTPVSKALPDSRFSGSAYRLNQSNLLGGDGSKMFSVGLSLGLIYCF